MSLRFRRKPESPYTKHEIVIPAKAGTSLSPTPYFSSNKIDPEDSRMFIKTLQYSVSTPKVLTCVAWLHKLAQGGQARFPCYHIYKHLTAQGGQKDNHHNFQLGSKNNLKQFLNH